MKRYALVALLACIASPAFADKNADDAKWIGDCVIENKDEKQAADVVTKYCTCMNNQMSDNESRSITEWEKANPKVMEQCSKESGWKSK
ncbi:hypothetical protein [Hyphomicrobium sp.]|uniref:hypothetical protein n=1 Tax=Hyphomicrobium sp. TaxID=82 RepID=UPI002E30C2F1|nr:hypothetical protein [Hyphomicrobium sp.]HEX2841541.1 hypothetical protein [Hyphomicrobium sp.]